MSNLIPVDRILNLFEIIEDKTNTMIHDIPEFTRLIDLFYKGDIEPLYLVNKLNHYIDWLASQNKINGQDFYDYLGEIRK